jgi:hypothetical protein
MANKCRYCGKPSGFLDVCEDCSMGNTPSPKLVERVARAMQPSLFGAPDNQVGPATLAERNRHREMAKRAIAALTLFEVRKTEGA